MKGTEMLPYRAWLITVDVNVSYVLLISHSYLKHLKQILDTWLALQSDGSRSSSFAIMPDEADLVDDIRIARIDNESDLTAVDGLYHLVGRAFANLEGIDVRLSAEDLDALVAGDWAEWSGIGEVEFKLNRDGTARIMFGDYNYCDPYDQRPYFVSLLINLSGVDDGTESEEATR